MHDRPEYLEKKHFFNQLMTLYGRKPVLEVLNNPSLNIYRLHLADSNKPQGIINDIVMLAQRRNIDIHYHDRKQLSRISKNSKQDQGVCIDIICPLHNHYQDFLKISSDKSQIRLLALDRVTNPQNLGMIIRSACAGAIDGILLADKGNAKLDALVVKASAGTLFNAALLHCSKLNDALAHCKQHGAVIYGLSSHGTYSLSDPLDDRFIIYVLGNESDGISKEILSLCNNTLYIPMRNQVESLNVAVTASLLAFREILQN
jgi:23S rRNA (guanosine2251-2'-O)-methyltransferase